MFYRIYENIRSSNSDFEKIKKTNNNLIKNELKGWASKVGKFCCNFIFVKGTMFSQISQIKRVNVDTTGCKCYFFCKNIRQLV